MNEWSNVPLYLLAAALLQNVVLSLGFASTALVRTLRSVRQSFRLCLYMTAFCLLTALGVFAADSLLPWESLRFWRPLIAVLCAVLWYILAVVLLRKLLPAVYAKTQRLLPTAAFNGAVVCMPLIINYRFVANLPELLALCVGSCIGFMILSLLTAEGIRRTNHGDVPDAFRGLPITLLYLGLLALALLGFSSPVSFV